MVLANFRKCEIVVVAAEKIKIIIDKKNK